jgi:predicted dinucleotide-binding enzyme
MIAGSATGHVEQTGRDHQPTDLTELLVSAHRSHPIALSLVRDLLTGDPCAKLVSTGRLRHARMVSRYDARMRIGIIGAGMIGSTVGKLWVEAGHEVRFASRHPEQLAPLVESLGQRASAGTAAEAAELGEVVMLTVPLAAVPALATEVAAALAGKIVLDTGNAYEGRDGETAKEASGHPRGSAGWSAEQFPHSRWVKAFNTVYFKTLETEAHREGDRIGIPLAGDDAEAVEVAARLVRDAGLDPVIVGALERGKELEPGTPVYNTGMSGRQVRDALGVA